MFGTVLHLYLKVCMAQVQKYFSLHPLWNLKVEIPLLSLALPRVLAWRIYSARLCTLIKVQIHMTPEHIKACSVHLLLFRPPNSVKGGQRDKKKKNPLRYADMFIPW